jgi:hypothetical protein
MFSSKFLLVRHIGVNHQAVSAHYNAVQKALAPFGKLDGKMFK